MTRTFLILMSTYNTKIDKIKIMQLGAGIITLTRYGGDSLGEI